MIGKNLLIQPFVEFDSRGSAIWGPEGAGPADSEINGSIPRMGGVGSETNVGDEVLRGADGNPAPEPEMGQPRIIPRPNLPFLHSFENLIPICDFPPGGRGEEMTETFLGPRLREVAIVPPGPGPSGPPPDVEITGKKVLRIQ